VAVVAYPAALSREELARRADLSAGGGMFTRHVSDVRGLGLLDYPAPGQVAATALLFPEGLDE